MSAARDGASSAVLADGRVLVSGGNGADGNPQASVEFLGTGASAGNMTIPRTGHVSVALKNGTVLIAGGTTTGGAVTNAAELFNPFTGASAPIASLLVASAGATATLLADGRVLIAGGQGSGSALQTMEMFAPASGQFANAAPMLVTRQNHAATLLNDGRVVIAGGSNGTNPLASAEIYDPVSNSISALPAMSAPRAGLSATTLLKGKVLLAGGGSASTDIFDPATGTMSAARSGHLALLLPNNNTVLMVGGSDSAVAEIFVSWTNAFAAFGSMPAARTGAAGGASGMTGIASVAGGQVSGAASNSVDAVHFPMVKTDKEDYQPGDHVLLTGSGFAPGEHIHVDLTEDPHTHDDLHPEITADANGSFSNVDIYLVEEHDLNIRFYLSATGATSGLTAGKTFTDAKDSTSTTVTCSPSTVSVGSPTTCTAQVNNTAVTVTNGFPQGTVKFTAQGTVAGTFTAGTGSRRLRHPMQRRSIVKPPARRNWTISVDRCWRNRSRTPPSVSGGKGPRNKDEPAAATCCRGGRAPVRLIASGRRR